MKKHPNKQHMVHGWLVHIAVQQLISEIASIRYVKHWADEFLAVSFQHSAISEHLFTRFRVC